MVVAVEHGERVLPALLRELDRAGHAVRTAELTRPTLDDVFLRLTGRSLREERTDASETDPAAEATSVGAPR